VKPDQGLAPLGSGAPVHFSAQTFTEADRAWMARALALAEMGLYITSPNPRVGCVLVRDGVAIGEGYTQPAGQDHAEVQALKDCSARGFSAAGATAYVSLEPCSHHGRTPPCTEALIHAGVRRVVAAARDPNPLVAGGGVHRLAAAGIETAIGLMGDEAREVNVGFFARMERGRPWVRVKMAASLDGRTALADGASQWITGPEARADSHRWRARACAVMTGIGTVLADDPALTVRSIDTVRQPMRVIVDRDAETPPGARVFAPGRVRVYIGVPRPPGWPPHVEALEMPRIPTGGLDLRAVVEDLARVEVNELHVESGARLAGSLIALGLVDELVVYLAPALLGDTARAMFTLPAITALEQRVTLHFASVVQLGPDLRIVGRLNPATGLAPELG
jgi:diaminohydroxyphosphoribosylaminopyrimidine deaminase/5-amino-6-(5-phosphoribosylamino)uracil reductase